jgi:hypothetical protein
MDIERLSGRAMSLREKVKGLLEEAEGLNRLHKDRIDDSRRRLEAAMKFEKSDRIPIEVWHTGSSSGWYLKGRYGLNMADYFADPELQSIYQLKERIDAFREFDDDQLGIGTTIGVDGGVVSHPSIIGCRIAFPADDLPWVDVRYHSLDTPEKIDDFQVPEIEDAGIMPQIIARYERMKKLVGDLTAVTIYPGDGVPERPLQMAAYARGYGDLIKDMHVDPPLAHKLMRKMRDVGEAIHDFYRDLLGSELAHVEGVDLYDNFLGHFSPSLLREFVLPHYWEWAQKYDWRYWTISSQCVLDPYIDIMAEVPTKGIAYLTSSSNLRLFKGKFAPKGVWIKVAYESNPILCKTPQGIAEECKGIIELMSPGGGFIMGTACIDLGTPVENLRAIISASKKFGNYGD